MATQAVSFAFPTDAHSFTPTVGASVSGTWWNSDGQSGLGCLRFVLAVRNAQRLVDRDRQLGVGGERIRILLNRASEHGAVEPRQIETALGYGIHHTFTSDYKTVSTALNSGVPLALSNHSEIGGQFDRFTRNLVAAGEPVAASDKKRSALSLAMSFLNAEARLPS